MDDLKPGDRIVGTQRQHQVRFVVLRVMPNGVKVRGVGKSAHWRKRELYLDARILKHYEKEGQ